MADEHRKDCVAFLEHALKHGLDEDYNNPNSTFDDITNISERLQNNDRAVRIANYGVENIQSELQAAEDYRAELLADLDDQNAAIDAIKLKLSSTHRILQRPKRDVSQWVFWALHTNDNILDVTRRELHELDNDSIDLGQAYLMGNFGHKSEEEDSEPWIKVKEPSDTVSASPGGKDEVKIGVKRAASAKLGDEADPAGEPSTKRLRVINLDEKEDEEDSLRLWW